jgi:hypothetical protein
MTHTEKNHLIDAYMSAWFAVKGRSCVVNIEPHGWFSVVHTGSPVVHKRRAVDILRGLVTLTDQLAKKAQQVAT